MMSMILLLLLVVVGAVYEFPEFIAPDTGSGGGTKPPSGGVQLPVIEQLKINNQHQGGLYINWSVDIYKIPKFPAVQKPVTTSITITGPGTTPFYKRIDNLPALTTFYTYSGDGLVQGQTYQLSVFLVNNDNKSQGTGANGTVIYNPTQTCASQVLCNDPRYSGCCPDPTNQCVPDPTTGKSICCNQKSLCANGSKCCSTGEVCMNDTCCNAERQCDTQCCQEGYACVREINGQKLDKSMCVLKDQAQQCQWSQTYGPADNGTHPVCADRSAWDTNNNFIPGSGQIYTSDQITSGIHAVRQMVLKSINKMCGINECKDQMLYHCGISEVQWVPDPAGGGTCYGYVECGPEGSSACPEYQVGALDAYTCKNSDTCFQVKDFSGKQRLGGCPAIRDPKNPNCCTPDHPYIGRNGECVQSCELGWWPDSNNVCTTLYGHCKTTNNVAHCSVEDHCAPGWECTHTTALNCDGVCRNKQTGKFGQCAIGATSEKDCTNPG